MFNVTERPASVAQASATAQERIHTLRVVADALAPTPRSFRFQCVMAALDESGEAR
jgi:hypothetical protein